MRRVFVLLVTVLILAVPVNAQAPLRAVWDYPDTEISNINRFEVRLDGAPTYIDVGIPTPESLPSTEVGSHSFTYVLPAMGNGNHSFGVRACNTLECSFETSTTFRLIGPPKNLRIVK